MIYGPADYRFENGSSLNSISQDEFGRLTSLIVNDPDQVVVYKDKNDSLSVPKRFLAAVTK